MDNGCASDNFLIFVGHIAPLERKDEKPTMIRIVEATADQLSESRIDGDCADFADFWAVSSKIFGEVSRIIRVISANQY